MAVGERGAHPLGEFPQQVSRAVVEDRVDRVEPQPIEMELLEPIQRIVDEEVADRRGVLAVEVDRGAPRVCGAAR